MKGAEFLRTAGGMLAVAGLAFWVWAVAVSVEQIRRTQAWMEAREDSLRLRLLESRSPAIEERIERLERSVSRTTWAARVSDVVALRRWMRRLDEQLGTSERRISGIEGRLDSLPAAGGYVDSVAAESLGERREIE